MKSLLYFRLSITYFYTLPVLIMFSKHSRALRRISCHGRNYSQPYFFKRNQSSDNRSHGFGAKLLLKKLSASDFSYERKSAFIPRGKTIILAQTGSRMNNSSMTVRENLRRPRSLIGPLCTKMFLSGFIKRGARRSLPRSKDQQILKE